MKATIKNLLSLSVKDTEHFKNKEKFELVSCPIHEKYCKELRPDLNNKYIDFEQHYINKDYQKSVDVLKSAYNRTFELKEPYCANCAEFFRSEINQSILKVQKEQRKKSRSLFGHRYYQLATLNLDSALKEIKTNLTKQEVHSKSF